MKRTLAVSSLFALSLVVPFGALRAQDTAPSAAPAAAPSDSPAKQPEKDTPLDKQMKQISKAAKQLRSQIDDAASNDSSLALVAQIKAAAEQALTLKPAKEMDLPADQQATFQQAYETGMKKFIAGVDQLATALKAGDNATAATILKDLYKQEKTDHHQFRKPKAE